MQSKVERPNSAANKSGKGSQNRPKSVNHIQPRNPAKNPWQ